MRCALLLVLTFMACKQEESNGGKGLTTADLTKPGFLDEHARNADRRNNPASRETRVGTVINGVRTINVEATRDGYAPDKIPGKPGEKLKLVFTRRESGGECMAELKSPDGKLHNLPLDKPYEIAVTVPNDGEVRFACGMDMFRGVIVAEKKS